MFCLFLVSCWCDWLQISFIWINIFPLTFLSIFTILSECTILVLLYQLYEIVGWLWTWVSSTDKTKSKGLFSLVCSLRKGGNGGKDTRMEKQKIQVRRKNEGVTGIFFTRISYRISDKSFNLSNSYFSSVMGMW